MDGLKKISNTKYQIHKPITREISEFPLVKLPQTAPKNQHHTKAKMLHYKNKEATLLLQSSLQSLLKIPNPHRTNSTTKSNMQHICSKTKQMSNHQERIRGTALPL